MGIVDKLKSLTGDSGGATYEYECGHCDSAFTAPERNPNDVSCPECGSDRVYSPV